MRGRPAAMTNAATGQLRRTARHRSRRGVGRSSSRVVSRAWQEARLPSEERLAIRYRSPPVPTGSRNPSRPAVTEPHQQAGHVNPVDPHVIPRVDALGPRGPPTQDAENVTLVTNRDGPAWNIFATRVRRVTLGPTNPRPRSRHRHDPPLRLRPRRHSPGFHPRRAGNPVGTQYVSSRTKNSEFQR